MNSHKSIKATPHNRAKEKAENHFSTATAKDVENSAKILASVSQNQAVKQRLSARYRFASTIPNSV